MNIRKTSAKISRYFLDKAIKYGTFKNRYPISYDELGEVLSMSPNECRICCEYLESIGCLRELAIKEQIDEAASYTSLQFQVNPSVVDFLENFSD